MTDGLIEPIRQLVGLPAGWEQWPVKQKQALLEGLKAAQEDKQRLPFFCQDKRCDGEAHEGLEAPHARASQRPPPGDWLGWLVLAGRGFGKTRIGAEWSWRMARKYPRGALVAPTAGDTRDVQVEGESGILAVAPKTFRPHYEPSKRRLTYPNGAIQTTYSADQPERLRGPQHHYAWGDEWCAWRFMDDATDMLLMGLRLGTHPKVLMTTTPKPRKRLREVLKDRDWAVTRGRTYDNLKNLAPVFAKVIMSRYEGTNLGRQELDAIVLDNLEGALWTHARLETTRIRKLDSEGNLLPLPRFLRIVVAIDPAAKERITSDETGIVVAASFTHKFDLGRPHYMVLEDLSGRYSPDGWAKIAIDAYNRWNADCVVGEINNGGDMVEAILRHQRTDQLVRYKGVHASRGKRTRAEPVAALYEQEKVHHLGAFVELEEQQCSFVGEEHMDEDSPDRLDALVWAITELANVGPTTVQTAKGRRRRAA